VSLLSLDSTFGATYGVSFLVSEALFVLSSSAVTSLRA
jgi:hypothetical protein